MPWGTFQIAARRRRRRLALVAAAALTLVVASPLLASAATPADAPTGLTATPGDGRVVLRWSAPASDGGSPIVDVEVSVAGGVWMSLGVDRPPATVAGLTNGIAYSFRVRAVTAAGPGAPSEPATATPGGTPGPITSPTITQRTETSITVTWSPPYDDGGSPITGYAYSLDDGPWTDIDTARLTVTGLDPGSVHALRVRARNASGPGDVAPTIDLETARPVAASSAAPTSAAPTGTPLPTDASTSAPTTAPVTETPGEVALDFDLTVDVAIGRTAGGRAVELRGDGLRPGSTVSVELRSTPVVLATASVDAGGTFSLVTRLPVDVPRGDHFVVARGTAGDGTPVERVGAFALDSAGRVVELLQDRRPAPLPGYRPTLPGELTESAGKPGVTIVRAPGRLLVYVDERGSTNAIAASIPSLLGVVTSLRNAVVAGFSALALAVLGLVLGAPAELLKARIKGAWAAFVARFPRRGGPSRRSRWIAATGVVAFLAAGQFLATFNAPLDEVPPLRQDLQNVVYGVLAVLLMSHVKQRPDIRLHREIHDDSGQMAPQWPNLFLTAAGVLFAQVTGLVPGFVVGVWAARRFRSSLAEHHTASSTWRAGLTLIGAAIAAWALLDAVGRVVPDASSPIRGFADSVLAMFVVGGTQGLLWSLVGPGEDAGRTLRGWSLPRWALLLFLTCLALVGIVAAGGSQTAALFRPSLEFGTELRLLASGVAFLLVLGVAQRVRRRGITSRVA